MQQTNRISVWVAGVAGLSAVLTGSGCALVPQSGRAATGERLWLDAQQHQATTSYDAKVGTVSYTDAGGQPAGSADVYERRTAVHTITRWRGMQGDRVLSDEDFFRLVGDSEAAAKDRAYRRRGRILLWTSVCVLGASVGYLTAARTLDWGSTVAKTFQGISVLSGLYGAFGVWYGFSYLHPDNHAVDYLRARRALEAHEHERTGAMPHALGVYARLSW